MAAGLYLLLGGAALLLYGWWCFHHDPSKEWWSTGTPGMKAFMSGVHGAFAFMVGPILVIAGIIKLFRHLI